MSSKAEPTWAETKAWAEKFANDATAKPRHREIVADLLKQANAKAGTR